MGGWGAVVVVVSRSEYVVTSRNGYGYTGAMFPASPCGWVGGVGGLVVVSQYVVVSSSQIVGMGMGIQELCSLPPTVGG